MIKTILIVLVLGIFTLLGSALWAGNYVEYIIYQQLEKESPQYKMQQFQRGIFHSTAIVTGKNYVLTLNIDHAPFILTGSHIAEGTLDSKHLHLNFHIDFQKQLFATGNMTGDFQATIETHGFADDYPENSTTMIEAPKYIWREEQQAKLAPFKMTLNIQNDVVTSLIPSLRLEKPEVAILMENIHSKIHPTGRSKIQIDNLSLRFPAINLETQWRNILYQQKMQMAKDGQTVSYLFDFSAQQGQLLAGGAIQFFIAPLRSIIPDKITAQLAINGIDKSDRYLFTQVTNAKKGELLDIIKRNLVTQEISADFQANLLRRGEGLKLNIHLQENANINNIHFFGQSLSKLFVGSTIDAEVSDVIVNHPMLKHFISPSPKQFLQENGFFHQQNSWHFHGKINDHGILQTEER